MTFDVQLQTEPMTLAVEIGEIYDVTGDEYARGYRAGRAAEQGVTDKIIDRSISGAYVNDRIAKVGDSAFYKCAALTSASAARAATIDSYAFSDTKLLASAIFPAAERINANAFRSCYALSVSDFTSVTTISNNAFSDCRSLARVEFPAVTSIYSGAFYNCESLKTVVLPGETQCKIFGDVFGNTPVASGTGYIYVPDDLVDSYKAADNWSAYADQIKPLSELEEA